MTEDNTNKIKDEANEQLKVMEAIIEEKEKKEEEKVSEEFDKKARVEERKIGKDDNIFIYVALGMFRECIV